MKQALQKPADLGKVTPAQSNRCPLTTANPQSEQPANKKSGTLGRIIFFALITLLCFAYLYYRLNGAAMREGLTLMAYMTQVFATVQWGTWLLIMVGYSLFYFGIDTLVVSWALNWFITDIRYRDILPVRASAYIVFPVQRAGR